ncbi:hypothetical protein [Megalodesulfovibrio paquesii]
MQDTLILPEWMQKRLVSDDDFATAYHEIVPHRRALIKSAIARLHALMGERRTSSRSTATALDAGMRAITWEVRVDTLVLALPPGFSSPAQLLAVVVPAQLAGVRDILVVHLRDDSEDDSAEAPPAAAPRHPAIAPSILAALELAGVETCLDLAISEFAELPPLLDEAGQWGAFITLESGCSVVSDFLQQSTEQQEIHCWFDAEDDLSLDDLRWLYGDQVPVYCWGAVPKLLPLGMEKVDGTAEQFQAVDKFLALAPEGQLTELGTSSHLACSPDALGLWIWPGLTPDTFFTTRRTIIG